jgi:hypothetical protein
MALKARSSNEGIHKSKTFDCKVKRLAIKRIMNGVLLKVGDVEAQQNVVTKLMDLVEKIHSSLYRAKEAKV